MIQLTVNKRKRCAGCGYDETLTTDVPQLSMTHQEQEKLFGEMKFDYPQSNQKHKHKFSNYSWIAVVGQ